MTKPIADILAPKPEARPRVYAYSIHDKAHEGLLKIGQTTRDVRRRIAEQLKTAGIIPAYTTRRSACEWSKPMPLTRHAPTSVPSGKRTPVRTAIGSGFETKTIMLSCGKLTTGVTVPQWSSI